MIVCVFIQPVCGVLYSYIHSCTAVCMYNDLMFNKHQIPVFTSFNLIHRDEHQLEWEQMMREREAKRREAERARQELETRHRIEARVRARQEAENRANQQEEEG